MRIKGVRSGVFRCPGWSLYRIEPLRRAVALSRSVSDAGHKGRNSTCCGSQTACCTESAAILEELRLECWTELMDMNALALGLIFKAS